MGIILLEPLCISEMLVACVRLLNLINLLIQRLGNRWLFEDRFIDRCTYRVYRFIEITYFGRRRRRHRRHRRRLGVWLPHIITY